MTHHDLTALAEACERAADLLGIACYSCAKHPQDLCRLCRSDMHAKELLHAHAAALRAGRVTVRIALAEACERAARLLSILCMKCERGGLCALCAEDQAAAAELSAHARALRAGRVTVREETA